MSLPSSSGVNRQAERGGRPAGGATGRSRDVVGVVRRTEDLVVALEVAGVEGQVRLAEHDGARVAQAGDRPRVFGRHEIGQLRGARRRPHPRGLPRVLDRHRHAVERPRPPSLRAHLVGLGRFGEGPLHIGRHDGVDGPVEPARRDPAGRRAPRGSTSRPCGCGWPARWPMPQPALPPQCTLLARAAHPGGVLAVSAPIFAAQLRPGDGRTAGPGGAARPRRGSGHRAAQLPVPGPHRMPTTRMARRRATRPTAWACTGASSSAGRPSPSGSAASSTGSAPRAITCPGATKARTERIPAIPAAAERAGKEQAGGRAPRPHHWPAQP